MRYLKASQMYAASTALNELFFRKKLTIIHLPTNNLRLKKKKKGHSSKNKQTKKNLPGKMKLRG